PRASGPGHRHADHPGARSARECHALPDLPFTTPGLLRTVRVSAAGIPGLPALLRADATYSQHAWTLLPRPGDRDATIVIVNPALAHLPAATEHSGIREIGNE